MAALQSSTEGHPPQASSRSFLDILTNQSSSSFQSRPSSTFKGLPSVAFSGEDIIRFSAPFRFALIGKFSSGRPSMESIRKSFISIGFAGSHTLGLIDRRHILIKFQREEDYVRCFLKRIYSIDGFVLRIFKWSPQFSVDSESAILPIWINFPLLPLHFFNKEALYNIARLIGDPLKMDASTTTLSRPSVARVCVEIDLRKPRPEKVWIINGEEGFWQPIEYEKIPPLCTECHKIGHQSDVCRSSVVAEPVTKPSVPKARFEYRPKNVNDQQPSLVAVHDVNASALKLPVVDVSVVAAEKNASGKQSAAVAEKISENVAAGKHIAEEKQSVAGRASVAAVSNVETSGLQNPSSSGEISARPKSFSISADPTSTSIGLANSKVCLLAPSVISEDLIPELLAVNHVTEVAPPLIYTCHEDIDETHRMERIVQNSVQDNITQPSEESLPIGVSAPAIVMPSVEIVPAVVVGHNIMEADVVAKTIAPKFPTATNEVHPTLSNSGTRRNSEVPEPAAIGSNSKQPFTRAELDDLLKNLNPIPIQLRPLAPARNIVEHPSSALIPAPKIEDVAPLAVLAPEATPNDNSSDFESEDQLCYNEDLEVQSSYFQPLALSRGRGKNKAQIQSDRVLRPRKKH